MDCVCDSIYRILKQLIKIKVEPFIFLHCSRVLKINLHKTQFIQIDFILYLQHEFNFLSIQKNKPEVSQNQLTIRITVKGRDVQKKKSGMYIFHLTTAGMSMQES